MRSVSTSINVFVEVLFGERRKQIMLKMNDFKSRPSLFFL